MFARDNYTGTQSANLYSTYTIVSHFNLLVQFLLLFVPEGWVAHQKDVQDDTWKGEGGALLVRGRGGEGRGGAVLPSPHAHMSTGSP